MIFGHEASAKPVAKYEASQLEQIAETFKSHNPLVAEELLDIEIVMPNVFVQDRTVLHMPERNIEILFLEGHTPASLGVWLPEEKILFVGDTVTVNQFPDMSSAKHAGLGGYAEAYPRTGRRTYHLLGRRSLRSGIH